MNDQEYFKEIAETIMQQLEGGFNVGSIGGKKISFTAYFGIKKIKYGDHIVEFIATYNRKRYLVQIKLNSGDLYDINVINMTNKNKSPFIAGNVYFDMLTDHVMEGLKVK